nr:protein tweety-2 like [Tanacetum cinerariifolium]
ETSQILDDTVRRDPLENLRKYRGGYDITNVHYWSSTAYTGIAGYVLAALWLLCGVVFGLVLGGNAKFHSRADKIIDIIIDTADEASMTIYNTTGAMKMTRTNLEGTSVDLSTTRFLDSTSRRLDSTADNIQRQARKNRHKIDLGLRILYIVSTVIFALNLIAVIALIVVGVVKIRRALHILIVLCWLITVFCWLFFGLYFFLSRFAGDTCTAFEGFQQDPYNNSLSSILPCDDLLSAERVLNDVSAGVYNLVNQVNANISRIQQDSSFGVCNPFSGPPEYNYQPNNCSENDIKIGEIPELLRLITCVDPVNGVCNGGIPISGNDFRTAVAYTSSIEILLNSYPGMESLLHCQTVKDAFSDILENHCKPVKRDVKIVWAGLVYLSIVMVFLVLTWTYEAYHERNHRFSDGSVKPHHADDTIELGISEEKEKEIEKDGVNSNI